MASFRLRASNKAFQPTVLALRARTAAEHRRWTSVANYGCESGAVRFEWDGRKAATNLKRRRVAFDEAVTVFYDPLAATFWDPDHSHDESRLITVGYSSRGRLVIVCHVERGGATRLISAQRATARERARHEG